MRPFIATTSLIGVAACIWAGAAWADAKATFDSVCSKCHEQKDFAGKSAAQIEEQIKGIVSGSIKHKKKLTLSDAEAKEMAAYLSGGK
jgi:mono/diheme cytochrome c family protein